MKIIDANSSTVLALGRCGENLARKVVFDITDFESLYGVGTVEILHQRPNDAQPYPLAVQRDGNSIVWNVTSTDTAMPSAFGKCELRYYSGETLVKSKIWQTWVDTALSTPSETVPPEPEQGWVDKVLAAGQAAVDASINSPKIGSNGNWWTWDFEAGAYVDTGVAASGGGSGAVSSVNGKTGAVKLTAKDVGAVPAPETASVGQTIVVKAVDDAGKPMEWEPVKLTEADKWELINAVTIADDAGESVGFYISLDKDGNPFSLRRARFLMFYPQYTGESEIPSYGIAGVNTWTGSMGGQTYTYTQIPIPSKEKPRSGLWEIGLDYAGNWEEKLMFGPDYYMGGVERLGYVFGYNNYYAANRARFSNVVQLADQTTLYPITSIGISGGLFFPGCKFWLYGVRI